MKFLKIIIVCLFISSSYAEKPSDLSDEWGKLFDMNNSCHLGCSQKTSLRALDPQNEASIKNMNFCSQEALNLFKVSGDNEKSPGVAKKLQNCMLSENIKCIKVCDNPKHKFKQTLESQLKEILDINNFCHLGCSQNVNLRGMDLQSEDDINKMKFCSHETLNLFKARGDNEKSPGMAKKLQNCMLTENLKCIRACDGNTQENATGRGATKQLDIDMNKPKKDKPSSATREK